jgi:triacylglycerol lipase
VASTFSSVTSDLAVGAWQGAASVLMTDAAGPYVGWLRAAAAQAEESAGQARAAAAAFEAARATVVDPGLVTANRGQLVSLVRSNLFGQNTPAIAATEATYEQMWAQEVAVMSGYHINVSAAVAQSGSWERALENLPGLPAHSAKAIAGAAAFVPQEVRQTAPAVTTATNGVVNRIVTNIFGSPAAPPVPATQNPTFTGTPWLANRTEVAGLWAVKDVTGVFGLDLTTQLGPWAQSTGLFNLYFSNTPPKFLPFLLGETVQQTTYDGMNVVQITPAHPSGHYVVALHGGAFIFPPSIFHRFDYTLIAHQTGATIEAPIYPLVQQGGTAGTVVPEIAGLVSMEIAGHGAPNVSVYGDSAGGNLALAAVEYLVANNETVPASMVLLSPWLAPGVTNPNTAFVHHPWLNIGPLEQVGKQWAGNLPENDPLVSPLDGSLKGLPPTYVYSGSLDSLAPDVVVLDQEAATQGALISFVLRTGEIHDRVLLSPDGFATSRRSTRNSVSNRGPIKPLRWGSSRIDAPYFCRVLFVFARFSTVDRSAATPASGEELRCRT